MTADNRSDNEYVKVGIAVWVSLCFFVCLYFWKSFSKGRQQFQTNLHVIEDGLRKMQEEMEKKQREKSIGCIDDVEDLNTFMEKFREAADSDSDEKQDGDDDRKKAPIKEEFEEELIDGDEKEADKESSEPEDKKRV